MPFIMPKLRSLIARELLAMFSQHKSVTYVILTCTLRFWADRALGFQQLRALVAANDSALHRASARQRRCRGADAAQQLEPLDSLEVARIALFPIRRSAVNPARSLPCREADILDTHSNCHRSRFYEIASRRSQQGVHTPAAA